MGTLEQLRAACKDKGLPIPMTLIPRSDKAIKEGRYVEGEERRQQAVHKAPYIQLLIQAKQEEDAAGGRKRGANISDSGFQMLQKAMKGEHPDCCICLCESESPCFTPCAHAACKACFIGLFSSQRQHSPPYILPSTASRPQMHSKCPICRRKISLDEIMECHIPSAEDLAATSATMSANKCAANR